MTRLHHPASIPGLLGQPPVGGSPLVLTSDGFIRAGGDGVGGGGMSWWGEWSAAGGPNNDGCYPEGSVVVDPPWTMVANKDTCDRPGPQPSGDPFWLYEGLDPTNSDTQKQLVYGQRYTIDNSGYYNGYRVWTVAGNEYSIFTVSDPLGLAIVNEELTFTADEDGWRELSSGQQPFVGPIVIDFIVVVREPDPTPTTFTGDWNYQTPPQVAVPGAGIVIHANDQADSFRISTTDNAAVDRYAELASLDVGDIIEGVTQRWAIQNIVDNTTWFDFTVAPAAQGVPDGISTFIFETVTATPITYIEDIGYWPLSPHAGKVQGIFGTDYDTAVTNDNAYGIDINLQEAYVSPDWDVLALSGGGGGGGGGLTEGVADGLYLRLDTANHPLTANLTILADSYSPFKHERPSHGAMDIGFTSSYGGAAIWRALDVGGVVRNEFAMPAATDAQATLSTTLKIDTALEATGTTDAQLRLTAGGFSNSVLLRNDGTRLYFLITDTEDGAWNSLRPLSFSLTDGSILLGRIGQHLDPNADLTYDLGDANLSWRRLYVHDIYGDTGGLDIQVESHVLDGGNWYVDGNFLPEDDLVHHLGGSNYTWLRLYVRDIYDEGGASAIEVDTQILLGSWRTNGTHWVNDTLSSYDGNLTVQDHAGKTYTRYDDVTKYHRTGSNWRISETATVFQPYTDNTITLGTTARRWAHVYSQLFTVYNEIYIPGSATTGSTAYNETMWHTTDYRLLRFTSARKHKQNIVDWPYPDIYEGLYDLKIRKFDMVPHGKLRDEKNEKNLIGLVADEVFSVWNTHLAATIDENGEPAGWSPRWMILMLILAAKADKAKLDDLEARVAALEATDVKVGSQLVMGRSNFPAPNTWTYDVLSVTP